MRSLAAVLLLGASLPGAPRVAVFRVNATPPQGEPLIWTTPVSKVEDPLWAKGIVIEDGSKRYVLCALDWCGVGGAVDWKLREAMGRAAGTSIQRVALHSVHQHAAPYIEGDGMALLREKLPKPPLLMSDRYLSELADKLATAVRGARFKEFDQIGTSQAKVERVASIRRLINAEGKSITRYSGDGVKPEMAAAPEGPVDPMVRTITLAKGGKPLVRLHFYATHPQTFCCDGTVSADFVGAARETLEKQDGIPQIYFTGCSGDVTVGKYNDRTRAARDGLAQRLLAAMRESGRTATYRQVGLIGWRTTALKLPKRAAPDLSNASSDDDRYRKAITAAFSHRTRPLTVSALTIGDNAILLLPGEPMLEFQRYAISAGKERFVAVAGYGDMAPGYLCTDEAFPQGGYEPGASNAGPGTEGALKAAIRAVLSQ